MFIITWNTVKYMGNILYVYHNTIHNLCFTSVNDPCKCYLTLFAVSRCSPFIQDYNIILFNMIVLTRRSSTLLVKLNM